MKGTRYKHRPDDLVSKNSANGWLYRHKMKYGSLLTLWTYRRFQFVLNNMPSGMTIGEFFMAVLDDAIAIDEGRQALRSERDALTGLIANVVRNHDGVSNSNILAQDIVMKVFPDVEK